MRTRARLQAVVPASPVQSESRIREDLSVFQWAKRRLLGIAEEETTFARRGFRQGDPQIQQRLEKVGGCFTSGYHFALDAGHCNAALSSDLEGVEAEFRGFAYEGAAMALALMDFMMPWKSGRLEAFLHGPAKPHVYMASVGAGWAAARLPRTLKPVLGRLNPLLRWLAVDGYGFHEGYFRWPRSLGRQQVPRRLKGYARRAFDQGLGRSLWFVECADVGAAADRIKRFQEHRRADLWCGMGLACAYAGALDESGLKKLLDASKGYHPQLAQGASFAAKARWRAGNLAPHTEEACRILCGMTAHEAVALTEKTSQDLAFDGPEPAYEVWRRRMQQHFSHNFSQKGAGE